MRRLTIILAMFGMALCLGAPARAAEASPDARALIERQLDAFAHDDAAGAYALATPSIQKIFPDADAFLSMVKNQYGAVYSHRSVEFGAASVEADSIGQSVTFVDKDNLVWSAVYQLARQADGGWRIQGCVIVKSTESSL